MNLEIHYADEWAALYRDGVLVERTVGDTYHAEEMALDLCGVERIHDDAFMRGGNDRADVAPTLKDVATYRLAREARRIKASTLRAEAARLLAEAEGLE